MDRYSNNGAWTGISLDDSFSSEASDFDTVRAPLNFGNGKLRFADLLELAAVQFCECPHYHVPSLQVRMGADGYLFVPLTRVAPATIVRCWARNVPDGDGTLRAWLDRYFGTDEPPPAGVPAPPRRPAPSGSCSEEVSSFRGSIPIADAVEASVRCYVQLETQAGKRIGCDYAIVTSVMRGQPVLWTLGGVYTYSEIRSIGPLPALRDLNAETRSCVLSGAQLMERVFPVLAQFRKSDVLLSIKRADGGIKDIQGIVEVSETPTNTFRVRSYRSAPELTFDRVRFIASIAELDEFGPCGAGA